MLLFIYINNVIYKTASASAARGCIPLDTVPHGVARMDGSIEERYLSS